MSDQDFFFDEDEKPAAKPSKPSKPVAKPPASKQAVARRPAAAAAPAGGIELTWTITALIAVVTLLLGVIIGYAIPKGAQDISLGAGTTAGQTSAPQLTPDQMSSGQLPAGHPDISGAPGSSGATGSTTTTTGK